MSGETHSGSGAVRRRVAREVQAVHTRSRAYGGTGRT